MARFHAANLYEISRPEETDKEYVFAVGSCNRISMLQTYSTNTHWLGIFMCQDWILTMCQDHMRVMGFPNSTWCLSKSYKSPQLLTSSIIVISQWVSLLGAHLILYNIQKFPECNLSGIVMIRNLKNDGLITFANSGCYGPRGSLTNESLGS